jgi:hypothetical protein
MIAMLRRSTGLRGLVTGLTGHVCGLTGDASGICGDVDKCQLTEDDRSAGVAVETLVNKEKSNDNA